MANWVLANDANALLIDNSGNGTQTYASAVPISVSGGVLSASLLAAGVGLDQGNLTATFDGNPGTVGKSPLLRLRLASNTLPNIGEQDFTLQWKLTMGWDSVRSDGERQVSINGGLSVHVGAVADGRVLLYANPQNKQVTAITGGGKLFSSSTNLTTQDVMGQVFVANASAYLDVDLMGLISKLDSNANLLKSLGYTPEYLLFESDYNLELSGIPLSSDAGVVQTISIIAPIQKYPNHAPVFSSLPSTLSLTEDTPYVLSSVAADPEYQNLALSITGGNADVLTCAVNGNSITFTPAANYSNPTGLSVQVKVSDVWGAFNVQNLNITIAAVNDPAVLVADVGRIREGSLLVGNVLANDQDIDSVLAVRSFYFTGATAMDSVTHFNAGERVQITNGNFLTLNANGDFSLETKVGASLLLPLVHYQTPDGEESTLSITVVPLRKLLPDVVRLREGQSLSGNVLANDSDIDIPLSVRSFYYTGNATHFNAGDRVEITSGNFLTLNANGDFTLETQVGSSGSLPLVYYQTPEGDQSTLSITVVPLRKLLPDVARVREGRDLSGNVLANDTDLDTPLAVQSFYLSGATSDSHHIFKVGETADVNAIASFTLNAQGDFVYKSTAQFSGDLPVIHYRTPQGEESTLSITVVPASDTLGDSELSGQVIFWNAPLSGTLAGRHTFVDGVQLAGVDELSTEVQSLTTTAGRYTLPGFQPASVLPLQIQKAVRENGVLASDVKSAITLSDVLDALKIYLNKPVANPAPYKYLAADFDANGTISISDVLGILKTYLGKTSSTVPSWTFVDPATDISKLGTGFGKAQVASTYSHTFSEAGNTSDVHNWVAVLRGDVNGSWQSATSGMDSLSHDQFLQLVGVTNGTV